MFEKYSESRAQVFDGRIDGADFCAATSDLAMLVQIGVAVNDLGTERID